MPKLLVLLANAFPFGTWEPFLERECEYYNEFDEVIIFSLSVRDEQRQYRRQLPPNILVVPIDFRSPIFYAWNSVRLLGLSTFWTELGMLLRTKRLTPSRFVQLAVFLSRADYESRKIRAWLERSKRPLGNYKTTLYSYRFLYQPFVMSKVASLFESPRIVARAHRADLYEDVSPTGYLPLRAYSGDVVDQLSLISQHGFDYIQRELPGVGAKASLDYLGTEDRGLGRLSLSRSPLKIVTCSNVVPVKRLSMVVSALSLLPPSCRVTWTHFGDGPLLNSLKEEARGLAPNVQVTFRGAVQNEEILQAYSDECFHVFVNSSSTEGLPVSIMEACSFGVPVIATDVGGNSEIVKDGCNGYLLPADVLPSQIANAILALAGLGNTEYERMRAHARAIWETSFNSDHNYRKFVAHVLSSDIR